MKLLLTSVLILLCLSIEAQREAKPKPQPVVAAEQKDTYHDYRLRETVPPYGLAKIKSLISKIKTNNDESDGEQLVALSPSIYQGLSLREKFTYAMIHPEVYSQNCDMMPTIQDEDKKIFAHLPEAFSEESISLSERQINFLKQNRDSVMVIIQESVKRSKKMGLNYKNAIVEINGKEMIPFLIETYNIEKKDHDILTILLLLMKQNQYKPFLESTGYKKLYGDDSNYSTWLWYSPGNEELIIKRATDFYNGLKH